MLFAHNRGGHLCLPWINPSGNYSGDNVCRKFQDMPHRMIRLGFFFPFSFLHILCDLSPYIPYPLLPCQRDTFTPGRQMAFHTILPGFHHSLSTWVDLCFPGIRGMGMDIGRQHRNHWLRFPDHLFCRSISRSGPMMNRTGMLS